MKEEVVTRKEADSPEISTEVVVTDADLEAAQAPRKESTRPFFILGPQEDREDTDQKLPEQGFLGRREGG